MLKPEVKLLEYQAQGVEFLKAKSSALLGDDVGLGKTIQAIAAIESDQSALRVLVLTPAILKDQWATELEKFVEAPKLTVIRGSPLERAKLWDSEAKYYVANYELLLKDLEAMKATFWDYIVADEATRLSNPRSKTWKAVKQLRAGKRLALTGTPISNRPDEIWAILDWINPQCLGNYWGFITRYCVKNYWGSIVSYKKLAELQARIKPYMIRRTKQEVLPQLPPKIESEVVFDLTANERKLYDQLRKEILFEIDQALLNKIDNPVTIQSTIVKLTRLRQLCDSSELLGIGTEKNINSSKLEALKEVLAQQDGRKVIIFTEFSQMADLLEQELDTTPLKITGNTSQETRKIILEEFNFNPDQKVLVMTSAGQYGLNIQSSSVVIHYDQPFSIAKQVQRVGRAWRLGQQQTVLEYHLLAKDTVDFHVRKLLKKKQAVSQFLLDDIKQIL